MAEVSPGQSNKMDQLKIAVQLKFVSAASGTALKSSDRTIRNVRDNSMFVFKRNDLLKNTLWKKHNFTFMNIDDIIPQNNDSLLLKCLIKNEGELDHLWNAILEETLTNHVTQLIMEEVPTFSRGGLILEISLNEMEYEDLKQTLGTNTKEGKEKEDAGVGISRRMRGSMAQSHVEPLTISLCVHYDPETLATTSTLGSHKEKLLQVMRNTQDVQAFLQEKDGFRFIRITGAEATEQQAERFFLGIIVYNRDQLDQVIDLVRNKRMAREIESYLTTTVLEISHVEVEVDIDKDKIQEWKSFFDSRQSKRKPTLAQKPTIRSTTEKRSNTYQYVPKTFCLYVPPSLHNKVCTVKIETDDQKSKYIHGIHLETHPSIDNIWTKTVHIPASVSVKTKYKYILDLGLQPSYLSFYGPIAAEKNFRDCISYKVERDIFDHTSTNTKEAVLAHFTHILQNADNIDINESIFQINSLQELRLLNITERKELAEKGYKVIEKNVTHLKSLSFIAILPWLSKFAYQSFEKGVCKILLKGIEGKVHPEMALSNKRSLQDDIIQLCRLVYKEDTSFVHLMTHMYPFFDESQMIDIFHSLGKYDLRPSSDVLWSPHTKSDWETRIVDSVILVCERAIENNSPGWLEILKNLLTCLPSEQVLICIQQILVVFKDHEMFSEDLECLISTVQSKYEMQITEYEKAGNASNIGIMWNKMDDISRASLQIKVETALIYCFQDTFLKSGASNICKVIQSMCEKYKGIFHGATEQKHLLEKLYKSDYDKCLNLFQHLIETVGFFVLTPDVGMALVCGWFEKNLLEIHHSGGSDRTKIQMMYEKLSSVLENAEIVINSSQTQDLLSDMAYSFLENDISSENAVTMTKFVWTNNKAEEIFFKHLKNLIYYHHKKGKKIGKELFKGDDGSVEVNKKHIAELVVTVMDIEGSKLYGFKCEEVVRNMVDNQTFWESVMTVKGRAMNVVKESEIYQFLQSNLAQFCSNLTNKRFNKSTFDLFSGKENDLFHLFDRIYQESGSLKSQWKHAKYKMEDTLKMMDQTTNSVAKLRRFRSCAGENFFECCNIVMQNVQNIRDEFTSGEIDLIGVFQLEIFQTADNVNFPEHSRWLSKAIDSVVFTNCNGDILKSFSSAKSRVACHVEEQQELFHVKLIKAFVSILYSRGRENYMEAWKPFVEGTDVAVVAIKQIFRSARGQIEIQLAKEILNITLSEDMTNALLNYLNLKSYGSKLGNIKSGLVAFGIDSSSSSRFMQCYERLGRISNLTLLELDKCLRELYEVADLVDDEMKETLGMLRDTTKSIALIEFLRKVVDEDMSNLVNSVEEFSEQNVNLSTVSSLIDVQGFLKPLLQIQTDADADILKFLSKLKDAHAATDIKQFQMNAKIKDCLENVHGIIFLYDNMANREEKTREIIGNIIERGVFHFSLIDGNCSFEVTYQTSSEVSHNASKLSDLKSQALLIMNTEKKDKLIRLSKRLRTCDFQYFVIVIDQAFGIFELCKELHDSGHDQYQQFEKKTDGAGLCDILDKLQNDYNEWGDMLHECRTNYPCMNYIYGHQIQHLYQYFILGKKDRDVLPILQFIHPNVTAKEVKVVSNLETPNMAKIVPTKAKALEIIAKKIQMVCGQVHATDSKFPLEKTSSKMKDCVTKGRLYIARLQKKSDLVTRVILSLYLNTVMKIPKPNQMLLCDSNTQWDEIYLLLRRCENENQLEKSAHILFCIAYVELLPSDLQSLLVTELQTMQNNCAMFLAIVIRCNVDHPFVNRFKEYVMNPEPLTVPQMEKCFQNARTNVHVFSSNGPGFGKTEAIYEEAYNKKKQLVTLHVSGPFNKERLVQKLYCLDLNASKLLHIDVCPTKDTFELDIFLFELLFLRMVSAGTTLYCLPTEYVCIELANTVNKTLEKSLFHVSLFQRRNISWKCFSNYRVSSERTSNVQVVCQYLKCFENSKLDTEDIYFTGPQACDPLKADECRKLLETHFETSSNTTFPLINIFVSVLAEQLKRLSMSTYFRTKNLTCGILARNTENKVKSTLVKALIDISRTFATKSIQFARKSQMIAVENIGRLGFEESAKDEDIVDEGHGMIRWEDSNHLIILFQNKDRQTVTALYKDLNNVPDHILQLFEIQGKSLINIDEMSSVKQQQILIDIARTNRDPIDLKIAKALSESYALTTDNILKMVLIWLRVQSHIPVIVMGETGCGKTSLVTYLSKICGTSLEIFNIHAGIDEHKIISKIEEVNTIALQDVKKPIWIFLDEINTNENIGLLSDILCHRKLNGRTLAPNTVVIAACNPYKLRPPNARTTPGLQSKFKTDKLSHLVYRVHPLPEALLEYVWDFGSLTKDDEMKYVRKMVRNNDSITDDCRMQDLFVTLITESQKFVRAEEKSAYSVSLRDVNRCQRLCKWFSSTFLQLKNDAVVMNDDIIAKAMILSLAHCYFCRFQSSETRQNYLEIMSKIFFEKGFEYSELAVEQIIKKEQADILEKMEMPEGTARNTALQENVFMILCSAVNRIPLFIVGKPGCSKSLSMQLIKSNLRGKDSRNEFFSKLPRIMCIAFQGSESCTSDGIIKVFEKAKGIQQDGNVLPLVVLDEIGLAEVSRFNPLKVLHSLLEPTDKVVPDVAVIGISNWALDAAKMNRAIHLCRPDMEYDDVLKTGLSIVKSFMKHDNERSEKEDLILTELKNKTLEAIAIAYTEYIKKQTYENFHGLRDYYSLIKYLSKKWFCRTDIPNETVPEIIDRGITRNFGGRRSELEKAKQIFTHKLKNCIEVENILNIPVYVLIKDNIMDTGSRHLMLISNGDAIMNILGKLLDDIGREYITIMGSKFDEDQTDDYNYRNLSQIILCMEQGKILILKDLENIYGSLYDMLNQNYTEFAQRKHCRVALGEYSNPMCYVHNEFKCIVLVEENVLQQADPPFLNRFEKQQFAFADLLPFRFLKPEKDLEKLCMDIGRGSILQEDDIFNNLSVLKDFIPIAGSDMITTLILELVATAPEISNEELLEACLMKLLYLSKPEAVLRLRTSVLYQNDANKANGILSKFIALPVHNGLSYYLDFFARQLESLEQKQVTQETTYEKVKHTVEDKATPSQTLEDKQSIESNMKPLLAASEPVRSMRHRDTQKKANEVSIESIPILPLSFDVSSNRLLVFTHSNIHNEIDVGSSSAELIQISHFKSKKSIEEKIKSFWGMAQKFLIIQFDVREDLRHLLLVKTVVDLHINVQSKEENILHKYVVIVLHLMRNVKLDTNLGQKLNFLSGWDFVYLDTLNKPRTILTKMINRGIDDVILDFKDDLPEKCGKMLFWAFTRLNYATSKLRTVKEINDIADCIQSVPGLLEMFVERLLHWLPSDDSTGEWVISVASDSRALYLSSSLIHALETSINEYIANQLAKMVYMLEELGALDCILKEQDRVRNLEIWIKMFQNEKIFIIDDIPVSEGPCSYLVHRTVKGFRIPFSVFFLQSVEALKSDFLTKAKLYMDEEDVESVDQLTVSDVDNIVTLYQQNVSVKLTDLTRIKSLHLNDDYFHDFMLDISTLYHSRLAQDDKIKVIRWIFSKYQNLPENFDKLVTVLHTTHWLYSAQILALLRLIDTAVVTLSVDLHMLLHTEGQKVLHAEQETISVFTGLVDYIFRLMIPGSAALQIMSIPLWQRKVNGLFCLSDSVGVDVPVEHILRFCHDFAVLLHQPYGLDRDVLMKIGDILSADNARLESAENFEHIFKTLNQVQKSHHKVTDKDLQRTLCMYVNRCFAAEPEQALKNTIQLLKTIDNGEHFDEELTGIGPTLILAMKVLHECSKETNEYDSAFLTILSCTLEFYQNQILIEYEILETIDSCLANQSVSSTMAAILVPLLSIHIYGKILSGKETDPSRLYIATKKGIEYLLKASAIMFSEREMTVRRIAAIAFLRTYLSVFDDCSINMKILDLSVYRKVCGAVNGVLNKYKDGITLFFLRCLENGNGLQYLQKRCEELADDINVCKDYCKDDTCFSSYFDLYPLIPHVAEKYESFKSTLASTHETDLDPSLFNTFLKKELCLCSITMIHCYYLSHVNGKKNGNIPKVLADKSLRIAETQFKEEKDKDIISFLRFMAGKSDLALPILQLSSETNAENFHIRSTITQFSCLIISQCSDENVWKQMIFSPDQINTSGLLVEGGRNLYKAVTHAITCSCGHRLLSEWNVCPVCKWDHKPSADIQAKTTQETNRDFKVTGISHIFTTFLINGCLYTALAIGKNEESIKKQIQISNVDVDLHFSLEKRLEDSWKRLQSCFGLGHSELGQLIQLIFYETFHLFLNDCRLKSEDEWNEWEGNLAAEINRVFMNKSKCMLNIWFKLEKVFNIPSDCFELQLLFPSKCLDSEVGKEKSHDLFLIQIVPNPLNLYAMLCIKSTYNQFPFLQLVLENQEVMKLPNFLPSLISWHSTFVNLAKFQLSKNEMRSCTVSEFLEKFSGEKRTLLENKFRSLKESWNTLSTSFATHLSDINDSLKQLGSLGEDCLLEDCIILGKHSLLYAIIEALAKVQNQFLDKVLELSCTTSENPKQSVCSATSFVTFASNESAIRAMNLMQVTEKDVILFNFDNILIYSQCGTTLQEQKDIQYDFDKIQLEIALQLFGKSFIIIPRKIPVVDFTDELYQNSALMLEEVKSLFIQKPLGEIAENFLTKSIESNPSLGQQLLTLTGVLLALLQSTESNSSMSLVDFIEKWKGIIQLSASFEILLTNECNLSLCHLVALHKFLEEANGAVLINSISQYYRENIDDRDKEFLDSKSKRNFHMLRHVLKALKVILHRCTFLKQCTRQKGDAFNRQQRLCNLLLNRSFWCDGCDDCQGIDDYVSECIKCVPETLTLKQFHSTIVFIKEKVEAGGMDTNLPVVNPKGTRPLTSKKLKLKITRV